MLVWYSGNHLEDKAIDEVGEKASSLTTKLDIDMLCDIY